MYGTLFFKILKVLMIDLSIFNRIQDVVSFFRALSGYRWEHSRTEDNMVVTQQDATHQVFAAVTVPCFPHDSLMILLVNQVLGEATAA